MRPGRGYASSDRYALADEHAAVLADEDSPAVVAGMSPVLRSLYAAEGGGSAPGRPTWGRERARRFAVPRHRPALSDTNAEALRAVAGRLLVTSAYPLG